MRQYRELALNVMANGMDLPDRTGTGILALFGQQMRFDLNEGFPLVTLKQTNWRAAFIEMLWMIQGHSNVHWLWRHGVHIWDEWADRSGDLGPVYGKQWRNCDGVDQLQDLITGLRDKPFSRRHIIDSWNVRHLPVEGSSHAENVAWGRMALPPCHCLVQFHVGILSLGDRLREARKRDVGDFSTESCEQRGWTKETWERGTEVHYYLDTLGIPRKSLTCQLYQRSADVFLGVPFNIAGYALLTNMLAKHLGYQVGEFIWDGGNVHIYKNHMIQVGDMVLRKPRPLPVLKLEYADDVPLWEVEVSDITVEGYDPHPYIRGEVSV